MTGKCCGRDPLSPDGTCKQAADDLGNLPPGWRYICLSARLGQCEPTTVEDWTMASREGVLCPKHAEAVQALLFEPPKLTPEKNWRA